MRVLRAGSSPGGRLIGRRIARVRRCSIIHEAFPARPTCLVTPGVPATHLNTHAIEHFMPSERIGKERSCAGTCKTLHRDFGRYV